MSVTATIQELLQGIMDSQYGRDMRQFIHDAIQKCYEEGSAGETDLEARERLDDVEDDIEEIRSEMISSFPSGSISIADTNLLRVQYGSQDTIVSISAIDPSTVVSANGEAYFGFIVGQYNSSKLEKLMFSAEYKKINGTTTTTSSELSFTYKEIKNYGPSSDLYAIFKATNTTSSDITLGRGVNNRIVADILFAYYGT